jgi:ABC-type uncharacterized transport system substrate-binding protein
VISSSGAEPYKLATAGFKKTFEKLTNAVFFDYMMDDQDQDSLGAEITKRHPGLILAVGSKAFDFAKTKFLNNNIIYCMVLRNEDVNAPNIAGVDLYIPEEYRLLEIKKILPSVNSLGIIYSESSVRQFEDIQETCAANDIKLVGVKIDGEGSFSKALDNIKDVIDSFIMVADSTVFSPATIQYLLEESMDKKFPVIGLSSYYTKAGALISFECDYDDVGVVAAKTAMERFFSGDKTEVGAKKFGYSVNVLVARRLGIRLSPDAVQNASEVFGK